MKPFYEDVNLKEFTLNAHKISKELRALETLTSTFYEKYVVVELRRMQA